LDKVHGGNKEDLSLLRRGSISSFKFSGFEMNNGTDESLELVKKILDLTFG
jgi:hypothetical protein